MTPLMEVADGIYMVDGVRIANVYLLTIDDGKTPWPRGPGATATISATIAVRCLQPEARVTRGPP